MNKKTKITVIIVVSIIGILILMNTAYWKFLNPHTWSRCTANSDCVPLKPQPGMNYFCEEGICISRAFGAITENKQCSADSDCVAATCCHAKEAVNKNFAPNCAGIFCTQSFGIQSCESGTLDCGQGEIKCINGACEVVLK